MSLTWSALPIAPNEDFDGAPLLRTEFGWRKVMDPSLEPPCMPRRTGSSRHTSTASPSRTMCSAQGGAVMSGGCAIAATT